MERTHKQGNPINPINRVMGNGKVIKDEDGIDEIAYFAAHAPDVPGWFQVDKIPLPDPPGPAPEIAAAAKEWDGTFDFADAFDKPGELGTIPGPIGMPVLAPNPRWWRGYRDLAEKYEQEYNAWGEQCRRIEQINTERRYFQWRWYYGEQMAAHRGRD